MKKITLAALLAASFVSVSAHAVEATINVTATVAPILNITAPGGAPLGATLALEYDKNSGKLKETTLPFQLLTNVEKSDFEFKIANEVVLKDGTKEIPLTVNVNDKKLSTVATPFTYADLYTAFTLTDKGAASKELKLKVVTTKNEPVMAGSYKGEIKLEVTQKP